MAVCLKPITIPKPGLVFRPSSVPPKFWRDGIKSYSYDVITVPCGKCINCLKRRQNDLAIRCQNEAEKRGSMCFCTLTYSDEYLPISSTLNRVNLETGELQVLTPPELVVSHRYEDNGLLRQDIARIPVGRNARYLDKEIAGFAHDNWKYFARFTPSVCREDVRLWLKSARVAYERQFKIKLPDFSYIAISEYGPRTCRPHYHLAFFGLSFIQVQWLLERWKYGYYDQKWVNSVNTDGSSGFAAAAKYIGKYMSKGKFECDSVRDCAAEKPRLLASIGLGRDALEHLRPWAMCFDLFGPYDPDSLRLDSTKKKLTNEQIQTLITEIPKRFRIQFAGSKYSYSLPVYYKRKIFYKTWKTMEGDKALWLSRPFAIWRIVADSLRNTFEEVRDREFRKFLSSNTQRTLAENCAEFAYLQEVSASHGEKTGELSLISFYSKSKF